MTSQKKGAALLGLPDRFVAAEIETEALPAFDAGQYSFFGDFSAADSGLEGALEDGLEAPPPEEGLSQYYGLHAAEEEPLDEDLSVATIFRNQLGLGPAKNPNPVTRAEPDDDIGLDALLTDPLSVARKQLRDDDYDHREEGLPAELYPAVVESAAVAVTQPQPLFGAAAASHSGLFNGYRDHVQGPFHAAAADGSSRATGSAAMAPQPLQPSLQPAPFAASGSALLQMSNKPPQQLAHAVTLKELEARILGSTEAPALPAAGQGAIVAGAGAPAVGHVPDPGTGGPDALAATVSNQQQQSMGLLGRPLPGTPAVADAYAMPGAVPPPSEAFFPQRPPGQPPGVHGMAPQLRYNSQHRMHGAPEPHWSMPIHMMPPGSAGSAMYPPLNLMYRGDGMMLPPPSPHHHPPGPDMLQQGPMGSQPYGPGGMHPPRGPSPPYAPGPMDMGGSLPYMHAGYPMRPVGPPPGMPVGPMHGMPPRPGPFGYGPPALGIGAGPGSQQQQQQLLAGPGPRRPPMLSGQPLLGPGGAQRPPQGLGSAGARSTAQAGRHPGGSQAAPDSGQQSARTGGAPTAAPVALAAAAAAAGRTGGAPSGRGGRLSGKWMPPEDVEYVVRSMLYTVANGVPYVEDYYYQAFVHTHVSQPSRQQRLPGACPMAAPFVPEALRTLSEDQMSMMRLDPSTRAKVVEGLQGLGKIVLSNIRTPKVLMDLSDREMKAGDVGARASTAGEESAGIGKGSDQGAGGRGGARSLEQEPFLAARIMIEDCMNLLLDVDDIDRSANHMMALAHSQQRTAAVVAALPHGAGGAGPSAVMEAAAPPVGPYVPSPATLLQLTQLCQRREVLLAGITGAFRLPNSPRGGPVAGEGPGLLAEGSIELDSGAGAARMGGQLGDGVLTRILALNKGRGVVARALLVIAAPASLEAAAATVREPQAVQGNHSDAPATTPAARAAAAAPLKPQGHAPAAGGRNEEGAASAGSLLGADVPSPFALLWGTLRNAWMVFGTSLRQDLDAATERPFLEATSRLAVALREALLRLSSPRDVVDAAAAFNAGCQQYTEVLCQEAGEQAADADADLPMKAKLLPLAQMHAVEAAAEQSAAPATWLGEALGALLTRASQLGLATAGKEADGDGGEEALLAAEWRQEYNVLYVRLTRHLSALGEIRSMALAATSGSTEALAVVRALSCRLLVNAMLQHASEEQAQELKRALSALAP
ncbi:hypothetical protein PLESTB_000953200 [Pleodorina starrii]|uniref:Uncharacterized protein n=1 Tax=Pleodorina starrii TaxID=330485 RepID=A0A9W6BNB8_9CHLO|nr:hypothetical protein PLESTM_001145400 [Pleodorina starrii]GLC55188.1 hypothetical protein PLESTB_000953200 [Pleodorina starrii]GLC71058.1 hypothetical protein PLESTF_001070200 [Pleodorina starrii]